MAAQCDSLVLANKKIHVPCYLTNEDSHSDFVLIAKHAFHPQSAISFLFSPHSIHPSGREFWYTSQSGA
jgi:hypothetical protein